MAKDRNIYIYGKHALLEALRSAPRAVAKIFLAPELDDAELNSLMQRAGIRPKKMSGSDMKSHVGSDAVHQGIIGLVSLAGLVQSYDTYIRDLKVTNDTALVILGELQDPHNVGAVIRSAAAFGISGVLIPEHNQAPITGAVIKVSAGMAFKIPLVSIGNVNLVTRDLKDRGFWIYGLDGEAKQPIVQEAFDRPTVFILGNESSGIRMKTKELCDVLLSIPMHSRSESLNAAASAAVAFYAWSLKHPHALKNLR